MKGNVPVRSESRDARTIVGLRTVVADKFGLAHGEVTNISAGGCGLRLTKRLRPGQYITLIVYPNNRTQAVQIDVARVKWVEVGGAGIEFLSVSPQNHELDRLCGGRLDYP